MKNLIQKARITAITKVKNGYMIATTAGVMLVSSLPAHAQLDAEVQGVFTDIGVTAGLVFAAAIVVWGGIRSSGAIFRLANKFLGKAGA